MRISSSTSVGDGTKDQPYARGQVVEDVRGGRYIVMREEGKDSEGRREYRVVRDFTRPLDPSLCRMTGLSPMRMKHAEFNYVINYPLIRFSAGDVTRSDVAYLVASGPSLRANWKHLLDVRHGVVVGVNQTPRIIPTERLDYFFCVDGLLDGKDWKRPMTATTGIFDVGVTHLVSRGRWKEMRWFIPAMRGLFYESARRDKPTITLLEHGLNVTFSALSWIVRALGAKTIVLVGMDFAYTDGRRHFFERLEFDRNASYAVAKDLHGRPVITDDALLEFAEWNAAACWFLRDAGLRVINATEGGIFTDFVEMRKLKDVVAELNAAPPSEPRNPNEEWKRLCRRCYPATQINLDPMGRIFL